MATGQTESFPEETDDVTNRNENIYKARCNIHTVAFRDVGLVW